MLTVIGLLLKGWLISALEVLEKYWRIVLPIIIIVLIGWRMYYTQTHWHAAEQALTDYKAQIVQASKDRDKENALKTAHADLAETAVIANHDSIINTIWSNSNVKMPVNATDSDKRNSLRNAIAQVATGLPNVQSATSNTSSNGADCDATTVGRLRHDLEEVSSACAITTADYNALHEAWDENCNVFGCK